MTVHTTPERDAGSVVPDRLTRRLLWCGAVAGPLFIAVALAQAFTREGFEPARHALSQLSLGDLGWVQITNFVLAGVLFTSAAAGMRRAMTGGPGGRWAPRLVAVFGVALVAGGVFVADPAFEFPPGTPPGAPDELSWHGIVHGFAPAIGFLALIVACFVCARWFAARGRRGWAVYSLVTGAAMVPLSVWPNLGGDPEGRFIPLWIVMVIGFGWASLVAAHLLTQHRTSNGATS